MTTYDISVFITKSLYDYADQQYGDPWRPRDRALKYIKNAVEFFGDNTVNRIYPTETPNPPYECPDGCANNSFSGPCICDPFYSCSWNNLYDWWKDWYKHSSCKDPHTEAQHTNLLLTKAHDCCGRGGGKFAVAATGKYIGDLPSNYQRAVYGTDEAQAMWVTLQEVGHSLIDEGSASDCDDDNSSSSNFAHDFGRVYDPSGWKPYITPMGVTDDTTYNNCCSSMEEKKSNINTSTDKGMHYASCAISEFK